MSDENNQPSPEQKPEQQPEQKPEVKPEDKPDYSEVDNAKAQLAAAQKELEKYRAKEQADKDAQKTASEKLAEREAEVAQLQRKALIADVRLKHGYTDKAFDVVSPNGSDEESIKAGFEAHKAALDEYVKSQGPKQGQGGGTNTGVSHKEATGKGEPVPFLIRHNLVTKKSIV